VLAEVDEDIEGKSGLISWNSGSLCSSSFLNFTWRPQLSIVNRIQHQSDAQEVLSFSQLPMCMIYHINSFREHCQNF